MVPPPTKTRVIGALDVPYGKGKYKVGIWTIAVTGTISVDTGFKHIEDAQVTVIDSEGMPITTASITKTIAPNIDIVCTEHQAAANIVSASVHNVDLLVIGYQHAEEEREL